MEQSIIREFVTKHQDQIRRNLVIEESRHMDPEHIRRRITNLLVSRLNATLMTYLFIQRQEEEPEKFARFKKLIEDTHPPLKINQREMENDAYAVEGVRRLLRKKLYQEAMENQFGNYVAEHPDESRWKTHVFKSVIIAVLQKAFGQDIMNFDSLDPLLECVNILTRED